MSRASRTPGRRIRFDSSHPAPSPAGVKPQFPVLEAPVNVPNTAFGLGLRRAGPLGNLKLKPSSNPGNCFHPMRRPPPAPIRRRLRYDTGEFERYWSWRAMVELDDETQGELERAAEAILSSGHLVALAGAGLSVESG